MERTSNLLRLCWVGDESPSSLAAFDRFFCCLANFSSLSNCSAEYLAGPCGPSSASLLTCELGFKFGESVAGVDNEVAAALVDVAVGAEVLPWSWVVEARSSRLRCSAMGEGMAIALSCFKPAMWEPVVALELLEPVAAGVLVLPLLRELPASLGS